MIRSPTLLPTYPPILEQSSTHSSQKLPTFSSGVPVDYGVMIKKLLFTILTLSSVALAAPPYYPNGVGMTWKFSSGEVQKMLQPVTVKGVKVSVLSHAIGGKLIQEDYLEYTATGVFLRGSKAGGKLTWYTPRLMVYPTAPLSPGLQWTTTGASGKNTLEYTGRVVGQEAVVNSAGRFNAVIVRNDITTSSGASSTLYTYFVPTIGPVRITTSDGTVIDLTK